MGYTFSSQRTSTVTDTATIISSQTSSVTPIQLDSTTVSQTTTIYQTVTRVVAGAENECEFTETCSVQSPLGLELLLSVNSTQLSPNNSISLNITEVNILSTANNVSFSNAWAIEGLEQMCVFEPATGFAVFSGYFALNNLSSAKPLDLWPIVPECPASFIFNGTTIVGILQNVTSYSFLPRSDVANYSAYYIPESSNNSALLFGKFSMSMSTIRNIFTNNSSEPTLNSVAPAVYTLAVGDEWGDLVLLHFSVT